MNEKEFIQIGDLRIRVGSVKSYGVVYETNLKIGKPVISVSFGDKACMTESDDPEGVIKKLDEIYKPKVL